MIVENVTGIPQVIKSFDGDSVTINPLSQVTIDDKFAWGLTSSVIIITAPTTGDYSPNTIDGTKTATIEDVNTLITANLADTPTIAQAAAMAIIFG